MYFAILLTMLFASDILIEASGLHNLDSTPKVRKALKLLIGDGVPVSVQKATLVGHYRETDLPTQPWSHKAVCSPSCQNGGKCVAPGVCECPYNYIGPLCEIAVCSPSCQNGGKCVAPGVCDCPYNYIGPLCEIGFDGPSQDAVLFAEDSIIPCDPCFALDRFGNRCVRVCFKDGTSP